MTRLEIGLRNLILNKKRFFWVLNISGWLFFTVGWAAPNLPEDTPVWFSALIVGSDFLVYFSSSLILRLFYKKIRNAALNLYLAGLFILITLFAITFIYIFIDGIFVMLLRDYGFDYFASLKGIVLLRRVLNASVLFGLWSALYFLINLIYTLQDEKLNKERALHLASEFRMEVLKNQINPHFLFNSLNSISALVPENSAKALKMIDELSDFLRFTLLHKHDNRITLIEELKFIRHYIYVQVIRFEERLECRYDIKPEALHCKVMPAILYPIVENAIKHGMNTSNFPLKVEIGARLLSNNLELYVKNTGKWVDGEISGNGSTHTGLENVTERLKCEYADKASLTILKESDFVEVILKFPVE